jgi:hypothetical protein
VLELITVVLELLQQLALGEQRQEILVLAATAELGVQTAAVVVLALVLLDQTALEELAVLLVMQFQIPQV